MKKVLAVLFFLTGLFLARGDIFAGNIGDPGATLSKGGWALGWEFSGVGREIRDGDGVRYDSESWRLLLKGPTGSPTGWKAFSARAGRP